MVRIETGPFYKGYEGLEVECTCTLSEDGDYHPTTFLHSGECWNCGATFDVEVHWHE